VRVSHRARGFNQSLDIITFCIFGILGNTTGDGGLRMQYNRLDREVILYPEQSQVVILIR